MEFIRLGKTELVVNKNGFGALPVQRVAQEDACRLLRKAFDGGINYFDTARAYSDSEEKIGLSLSDVRSRIVISTKTAAKKADDFWRDLETSLKTLRTDHIDIYQFHNPPFCPRPGEENGLYDAMLSAREQGMVRHIGITNHRLSVAREAIESGLYETLQFPFSYLAGDQELSLVASCEENDMGFICMKALAGGLITHAAAAYAYLAQYPVEPIWGIQREEELDEFLSFQLDPPSMTEETERFILREREELSGDFCRGCGYCMPCPAGIEINTCARMSLLLRRSPAQRWLTPEKQAMMRKIEGCLHCNSCKSRCPYGLDTPALLEKNYRDYLTFLPEKEEI